MATGRLVYLKYDYMSITYTGKRSPHWYHCKLAADENGKFLAMENHWICDHGPYSEFGDHLVQQGQFTGAGYDIPNIRGHGRTCAPTMHGARRSVPTVRRRRSSPARASSTCWPTRWAWTRSSCATRTWPSPAPPTGGQEYEVYWFKKLFDMVKPYYDKAKKRTAENSTAEVKKGVGISLGIFGAGGDGEDVANAAAELRADGGVRIYNTWEDHGQGSDVGTLGTAHEALRPLGLTRSRSAWT